ncbi:MAG: hypothetical protein B6D58_03655 [candidate division Zixibacteria bacterium 4484_95]|nr:MAG: hypothetical protein B6D58_03655 [candidate division Zixibacteria bacterium 4484_95]
MSIIFVDHQTLAKLAGYPSDSIWQNEKSKNDTDYLAFLDTVRQAVNSLDDKHRRVIEMYFFENLSLHQIEQEMEQNCHQVQKLLREAMLMLKYSLTDVVRNRWPERFKEVNRCPICKHPQRKTIEKIIKSKKEAESWGTISKRLKKKVGETFNPPSTMINHIKYHKKG